MRIDLKSIVNYTMICLCLFMLCASMILLTDILDGAAMGAAASPQFGASTDQVAQWFSIYMAACSLLVLIVAASAQASRIRKQRKERYRTF